MNEAMYQEILLDRYRHPQHRGTVLKADAHGHDVNTSCGDNVTVTLRVKDGVVKDAKFEGNGCAISMAASDILMEIVVGKSVKDVMALDKQAVLDALGVPISGMRLKCALLGFKVLKMAVVEKESR